jgi:hypothetical protein
MTSTTQLANGTQPIGQPGDFDFLSGSWKIQHRRLLSSSPDVWDTFDGEATCWSILGGMASVEELRIPARDFNGMGLRVLDRENQVWSDFWMNAKVGTLLAPGVKGYFQEGRGVFVAEEMDGNQAVLVRGVWDNISATTCRWQQSVSSDGGKHWQTNWSMDWVRAN